MALRQITWALVLVLFSCSHASKGPIHGDSGGGWGVAQPIADLAAGKYDHLVIVGTNDFHGYLRPVEWAYQGARGVQGGAEWFAGYVDILQRRYGDALILLDAGDMYQGTLESNWFHGQSVKAFYDFLPYRALAVGNHEFDYGPLKKGDKNRVGTLEQLIRSSAHPFVQANIYLRKSQKVWTVPNLFPSVMVTAGGHKVGIVGLTTTTTPAKTLPQNVETLEFRDFAPALLEQSKKLRARGAELVLLTTHEGDGTRADDPISRLLHAVPAGTVDAVVAGHTHTEAHLLVNGVPVIESKTRGQYFGRIDLYVSKATGKVEPSLTQVQPMHAICGTWFHNADACDLREAQDAIANGKAKAQDLLPLRTPMYEGQEVKVSLAARAVLAPYLDKATQRRQEVLGQATRDFELYPSGETEMGVLMLDSFRDHFPQAKVVVMNGGGIRRRLLKGPITYGDLYEMNPFDNVAVMVKMTGRELKELLKTQVSGANMVPAVLGVKVNYFNRDDAAFDRDLNGDGKKEKWERDRLDPRIGLVWEGTGKIVDDKETFWVATIDYLLMGGDNTGHVFSKIPASRRKYFDISPRDVAAEYLRQHPGIELPHKEMMRLNGIKGP